MIDNPYTPPSSQIDQPVTVQGRMARPWQVVMAIRLAVVKYGIGFAVSLATWDHSFKSIGELMLMSLPYLLVMAGLYYRIYLGRNWARITLLILFMIGAVMMMFFGYYNQMSRPVIEKVQSVVSAALNAAVLYFLFASPGRHWFRRRGARDASLSSPEAAKPESRA